MNLLDPFLETIPVGGRTDDGNSDNRACSASWCWSWARLGNYLDIFLGRNTSPLRGTIFHSKLIYPSLVFANSTQGNKVFRATVPLLSTFISAPKFRLFCHPGECEEGEELTIHYTFAEGKSTFYSCVFLFTDFINIEHLV